MYDKVIILAVMLGSLGYLNEAKQLSFGTLQSPKSGFLPLLAALAALLRDRTVLVIAHRLYTIQHADKIIVLDNGRVAGQGTHAELLSGQPLYAHLWSLQTQSLTTEVAR